MGGFFYLPRVGVPNHCYRPRDRLGCLVARILLPLCLGRRLAVRPSGLEAAIVKSAYRIPSDIRISVDPSPQPDRIALDVLARERVIVSEIVVVEPRLRLVVLAWKAQVVG